MTLANPLAKWLWDGRRSVMAWTLAITGAGGGYALFWPTMDNPQTRELIESYPEAILEALNYTQLTTAAGYLNATIFGLVVALLFVVYSVSAGARIVAGDEEAGTLDLILAHPLTRTRLALQLFGSYTVSVAIIAAALVVVLLVLRGPAHLKGISIGGFAAMYLHLVMFAVVFGAVSYSVGAATGRKAAATGAGATLAVFGFAANGLLPQVEGLEWTENLSPFQWLNGGSPLQNGVQPGDVAVMAGLVVVLLVLGTWAFDRRDVAV